MTRRARTPPRTAIAVALLSAVLVAAGPIGSRAQVSSDVIAAAISETVQLIIVDKDAHQLGTCSGSFVTPGGLILTAGHCVRAVNNEFAKAGIQQGQLYNPDGLAVVAVNIPNHDVPVLALVAKRVADNPSLDLALLQTIGLLGQQGVQQLPGNFRVPYMSLADSDTVRIGDPIAALGFPGIGGNTITVTQGHVTGFVVDEQGVRLFMKHDAGAAPGNSGGPIIDARGAQVAVVSQVMSAPQTASAVQEAVLTDRIPMPWGQYFQGSAAGGASSPPQPAPPKPAPAPSPSPSPSPPPPAPPKPSPAAGAVLQGRVVNADSGAGIQGAVVAVLRPGASFSSLQNGDILAEGQTDGNGAFQTGPPVPKGATYPVGVFAKGYQPIAGTFQITSESPDVIVLKPIGLRQAQGQ
jgi:S1-C subfamily serine protease